MKSAKRKVHRHLGAAAASKVTERLIPRKAVLDMERGLTTSRNTHESKFGKALLTALTHDDFALTTTLNVLRAQSARTQAHCNQERRAFIHHLQVLPDPTILLERPPSPVRTHHARSEPGYMRATAAKPSPQRVVNFATIDAFAVEKSRLTPAWEVGAPPAPPTVRNTRFRCLSKPSTPLSRFEKHDLVRGLTYHARNVPQPQQATGSAAPQRHGTNTKRREAVKARVQAIVLAEEAGERQEQQPRVFITDVSDTKAKSSHKTRLVSRQVSFGRMPTHDSGNTTSRKITSVSEETEIDKSDASATTVSKRDARARAKAMSIIPNAGTAKAGKQAAIMPHPKRSTSATRKHKKEKNKGEQTKYRRAGLNLVHA